MDDNHFHLNYRRVLLASGVVALFFFVLYAVVLFYTLHDMKSSLLIGLVVGGIYGALAIVISFIWSGDFFHRR